MAAARAPAPNVWGEPSETAFRITGHREAGKYLASGLLEQGVDMAYAYKPLHHPGLAHAFLNTIMFLDYDRVGFPVPGRRLPGELLRAPGDRPARRPRQPRQRRSPEADLDPPSPSPKRCMEVGAATARVMRDSPWRTALIASSSWSHAFLTDKNHQLYPDIEADRRLYEALRSATTRRGARRPLAAIEASGQQEMLNWYMLAGAMEALGRKPDECDFLETWSFNSNKCFATFMP